MIILYIRHKSDILSTFIRHNSDINIANPYLRDDAYTSEQLAGHQATKNLLISRFTSKVCRIYVGYMSVLCRFYVIK